MQVIGLNRALRAGDPEHRRRDPTQPVQVVPPGRVKSLEPVTWCSHDLGSVLGGGGDTVFKVNQGHVESRGIDQHVSWVDIHMRPT